MQIYDNGNYYLGDFEWNKKTKAGVFIDGIGKTVYQKLIFENEKNKEYVVGTDGQTTCEKWSEKTKENYIIHKIGKITIDDEESVLFGKKEQYGTIYCEAYREQGMKRSLNGDIFIGYFEKFHKKHAKTIQRENLNKKLIKLIEEKKVEEGISNTIINGLWIFEEVEDYQSAREFGIEIYGKKQGVNQQFYINGNVEIRSYDDDREVGIY